MPGRCVCILHMEEFMRSLLLASTALVVLSTPAMAFNFGVITQVGVGNSTGSSSQLIPAAPIDQVWANNVLAGSSTGNFNTNQINQKAGKWSTNTALAVQVGNGNRQSTDQQTDNGTGFYTPPVCVPFFGCIVPSLPVPTHLNSNDAWTVQVGDANYAMTYQRRGIGNGNKSGILQVGWANGTAVFQVGGNSQTTMQFGLLNGSITGQFGENNEAGTYQFGMLNGSIVGQFGDDNSANTAQIGVLNGSAIGQLGEGNSANTLQIGALNGSAIGQAGFENEATTTQVGAANLALTGQAGAGNEANTSQIGAFNVATTGQVGVGNEANITQVGFGNTSEVSQASQHNWASVGQVGEGNSVELVQGTY